MGWVNVDYIPAAILLDNPGIDRCQFAELLDQIREGTMRRDGSYFGFSDMDVLSKHEISDFHLGLYGLGAMLGLGEGFVFPSATKREFLKENFFEGMPRLVVIPRKANGEWHSPAYQVIVPTDYENREFRRDTFFSLDELLNQYPELSPDKIYPWENEKGIFLSGNVRPSSWGWKQKNGRYYLDDIPNSERFPGSYKDKKKEEADYSSIVITAEAIRKKAWNLFGMYGYCYTDLFLVSNPDSMERHERAVRNYWLSNLARQQNLSNADLLRLSLSLPQPKAHLSDPAILSIVYEEGTKYHGYIRRAIHSDDIIAEMRNQVKNLSANIPSRERAYPPIGWEDIWPITKETIEEGMRTFGPPVPQYIPEHYLEVF